MEIVALARNIIEIAALAQNIIEIAALVQTIIEIASLAQNIMETVALKVKVKAVCASYSTAALRHIVLIPEWVPSFISRGAAHTKRRERPLLTKEGTIPGI